MGFNHKIICGFFFVLNIFYPILVVSQSGSCASYGCVAYNSAHSCQCNEYCSDYNDCCSDFESICESCKQIGCNYVSGHYCQCDESCVSYSNCCPDYEMVCNNHIVEECLAAPVKPNDRRTDKTKLRLIAYNVDFLFTNYSHSQGILECPGSGCDWDNNSIAWQHLTTVSNYIASLNPDIIGLEETEDCFILNQLINNMPIKDPSSVYVPYQILGTDTYTGQNPGILTKIDPIENLTRSDLYYAYPITGSQCGYTGSGYSGNSKHYNTRFKIDGFNNSITLIGLHLLAYPTDTERCAEREAQALVLQQLIETAYKRGDDIIVLGDFNDYSDDVPDVNNNKPISQVIKIVREAGNLTEVSKYVEQSERYTDWDDANDNCVDNGGKEHSMIDHILVSSNLASKISNVTIDHSYTEHCQCLYSDHWPVIVDFDFTK